MIANPAPSERCHVNLIDFYQSKLPRKVHQDDYFYARPLPSVLEGDKLWFACSLIGVNKLGSMVKGMFSKIGATGGR